VYLLSDGYCGLFEALCSLRGGNTLGRLLGGFYGYRWGTCYTRRGGRMCFVTFEFDSSSLHSGVGNEVVVLGGNVQ
jgi:hypothetical protein